MHGNDYFRCVWAMFEVNIFLFAILVVGRRLNFGHGKGAPVVVLDPYYDLITNFEKSICFEV